MATLGVSGVIALVGALVGTASAVQTNRNQKKSRKSQERAQEASARTADLKNARQRRAEIVKARRLRAQTVAQGENSGISGGSQVAGAAGSIQSQAASNISFLNQLQGLDQNRFNNLQDASNSAGKAATFQAIGNAGFSAAANSEKIAGGFS